MNPQATKINFIDDNNGEIILEDESILTFSYEDYMLTISKDTLIIHQEKFLTLTKPIIAKVLSFNEYEPSEELEFELFWGEREDEIGSVLNMEGIKAVCKYVYEETKKRLP